MTDEPREALAVDMIKCDGHGICAWLSPERIRLDDWGYPLVNPAPFETSRQQRAARAAVRACPRKALDVVPVRVSAPSVAS